MFASLGREAAWAWAEGDGTALEKLGGLAGDVQRGQLAFRTRRRCFRVEGIQVGTVTVNGERATSLVAVAMHQIERETGKVLPSELRHLEVTFSRKPAGWRISALESAEAAFAGKLAAAKSESEGDALLDIQPELVTRELDRRLTAEAYRLVNMGAVAAATRAARLARRVVAGTGDDADLPFLDAVDARCLFATARADAALALIGAAVTRARTLDDADTLSAALAVKGVLLAWTERAGENFTSFQAAFDEAFALLPRTETPGLAIRGYGFLALLKAYRGDWRSGVNDCLRAITLANESGDTPTLAYVHLQMGIIYANEFDLERSIYYLRLTLPEHRAEGRTTNLIIALITLSRDLTAGGRTREARALNAEALDVAQSLGGGPILASVHYDRGRIALNERHWLEARQALEEMACEGDRYHINTSDRSALWSELELRTGHYEAALRYAEDVLARAGGNLQIEYIGAMTIAARAERGLGHLRSAELWMRDAIDTLEQSRSSIAGPVHRRPFAMQSQANCYEELVDLLVEQGRNEEALRVAERSKARTLLELLSSRRTGTHTPAPEAERARRQHAIEELTREAESAKDPGREASLRRELAAARIAAEELDTGSGEKGDTPSPSGSTITRAAVATMLVPGSAFVEFVVGPERTYRFLFGKDLAGRVQLRVHAITVRREELKRQVDAFLAALAERDMTYGKTGAALEHLLFSGSGVDAYETLCLIPDGPLWDLQFDALKAGGRHFVERHALFYAPSIAAYQAMTAPRARQTNTRGLLAFGNPSVPARQVASVEADPIRDRSFVPLPEAETEVERIADLYGRDRSLVFVRGSAVRQRVLDQAPRFRTLHFATHGVLDDSDPLYSYLLLADGRLEAWEILQLNLDADLVVLSACETARGVIAGGDGIIGVTWAFFVSGARAMVATSWKVDSSSAEQLCIELHRRLVLRNGGSGFAKAKALQRAQLEVMRTPAHHHPFYWAAFRLVGDGR